MIIFLLLVFLLLYVCCVCVYEVNKEQKIKRFFVQNERIIPIDLIICFSNSEFIRRFKRYFKGSIMLYEYADGKYFEINSASSENHLLYLIERKQEFMIDKRYEPDKEYEVNDYINKIMYEIWLDYSYSRKYKTLFWREISNLYREREVSLSTYNEINRRFYKYKAM